MPYISIFK